MLTKTECFLPSEQSWNEVGPIFGMYARRPHFASQQPVEMTIYSPANLLTQTLLAANTWLTGDMRLPRIIVVTEHTPEALASIKAFDGGGIAQFKQRIAESKESTSNPIKASADNALEKAIDNLDQFGESTFDLLTKLDYYLGELKRSQPFYQQAFERKYSSLLPEEIEIQMHGLFRLADRINEILKLTDMFDKRVPTGVYIPDDRASQESVYTAIRTYLHDFSYKYNTVAEDGILSKMRKLCLLLEVLVKAEDDKKAPNTETLSALQDLQNTAKLLLARCELHALINHYPGDSRYRSFISDIHVRTTRLAIIADDPVNFGEGARNLSPSILNMLPPAQWLKECLANRRVATCITSITTNSTGDRKLSYSADDGSRATAATVAVYINIALEHHLTNRDEKNPTPCSR
jgi:hypothetical protein